MKGIFGGKWRLNLFGKLTIGLLTLLSITLYFYIDHLQSNNYASAVNNQELIAEKEEKTEGQSSKSESIVINKGNAVDENLKKTDNDSIVEGNHEEDLSQEVPLEEQQKEEFNDKVQEEDFNTEENNSNLEIGKVVYLTFDDGPNMASEEIMRLLKKYNAKATFFMLEPNMNDYPDTVKRMVNEGHTVGVHGVSHNVAQVYKSPLSFVGEMETAIQRIDELTSVKTRLIRAPFGSKPYITQPFTAAIDQENMIMWDWNIDSVDWKLTNGEYVQKVINQINESVNKVPLIVLMHDKQSTAAHLEKLLIYLINNGFVMEAINEAMEPIQFK